MMCKICSSDATLLGKGILLNKYSVSYFQCTNCGFVQTESPYWLPEAYSSAITKADLGLANRNLILSKISKAIIVAFFNKSGSFLDYGSGYGLFVRLMRDKGFNFYWYDKYCDNLFAKGFEKDSNLSCNYELLTAFEVFEHLESPVIECEQMLKYSQNILFTTNLLPDGPPKPGEWWYYGLEHGQHIALYPYNSLVELGKRFGLNLYSDGKSIHLLTKKSINAKLFKFLCQYKLAVLVDTILKQPSLIIADYQKVTGRTLEN